MKRRSLTNPKKLRRSHLLCLLLILFTAGLLLSACDASLLLTPTPDSGLPVDSNLREYYNTLGEKVLGPVISEVFTRSDGMKCQYVENGLMCFNPYARNDDRVGLVPLSQTLTINREPPNTSSIQEGGRIVDGYLIYEKFLPLYDQIYGARTTGRPVTNMRTNNELNRVEQFFENVGFFQSLDDPNGPAYLISYGAYACLQSCSPRTASKMAEYWKIIQSNMVEQPFSLSISRMGGMGTWGTPLLQPNITNGATEQVYSNVIFYSTQEDPSVVQLRPLPSMLGILPTPLEDPVANKKLIFYNIRDGKGYNVVIYFDRFIAQHGGPSLSGKPITGAVLLHGQKVVRQCFENYCLLYDPSAAESLRVRMAPLGEDYLKDFPPSPALVIQNIFTPDHIFLMTSPARPVINPSSSQFISMVVLQKDNSAGVDRVEATLVITLPDGRTQRFFFQPTDEGGMSTIQLRQFSGIKHGERVSYQVCLNLPSDIPICHSGTYLIWNTK